MLLTAKMLAGVGDVNHFTYTESAQFTMGDAVDVYFQLVDAANGGLRYMPAAAATLQVVCGSIDDAKRLTRTAIQPFSLDPSIWKFSILSTDVIQGTNDILLKLTESARVTSGAITRGLSISPQNAAFI